MPVTGVSLWTYVCYVLIWDDQNAFCIYRLLVSGLYEHFICFRREREQKDKDCSWSYKLIVREQGKEGGWKKEVQTLFSSRTLILRFGLRALLSIEETPQIIKCAHSSLGIQSE